jgi:hypothetical protein
MWSGQKPANQIAKFHAQKIQSVAETSLLAKDHTLAHRQTTLEQAKLPPQTFVAWTCAGQTL